VGRAGTVESGRVRTPENGRRGPGSKGPFRAQKEHQPSTGNRRRMATRCAVERGKRGQTWGRGEERGEWVRGEGRNGGGDWRRRVQIRLHVVWPQKPRRKIIWNTEPLKEGPEEDMRSEVLQWLFMEAPLVLALQRGGEGGAGGGSGGRWNIGRLGSWRRHGTSGKGANLALIYVGGGWNRGQRGGK